MSTAGAEDTEWSKLTLPSRVGIEVKRLVKLNTFEPIRVLELSRRERVSE